MVALSFISVSIVEYVAYLVTVLALFRYPVKYYWPQILFTSSICSLMSYAMSVDNDVAGAPLIQLAVLIICMCLMFHTPLLWSVIICISTFVVFIIFQGGIIYLFYRFGWVPSIIPKTSISIYLIQLLTAAVELLIAHYLIRKRIGFLFVPTSREHNYVWNSTGVYLFIGSIISFILLIIVYFAYTHTNIVWFPVVLGILSVLAIVLLSIMRKKNSEYVDKPWTR
jgi:hypothetical protein